MLTSEFSPILWFEGPGVFKTIRELRFCLRRLGQFFLLTQRGESSLQYQNRKAEYFNAIWDVINWKAAEKRFK